MSMPLHDCEEKLIVSYMYNFWSKEKQSSPLSTCTNVRYSFTTDSWSALNASSLNKHARSYPIDKHLHS